ncbi:MAG: HEPN domain-containing protein [Bacteroidales bacterium]
MKNKQVKEWFIQSDYDLETADAMLKTGRFVYCVFMCHLALEKALKGLFVKKFDKVPSKIHNLIFLADELNLVMTEEQLKFIYKLNALSITTRYPDELKKLIKVYNLETTEQILNNTKEIQQWIKKQ